MQQQDQTSLPPPVEDLFRSDALNIVSENFDVPHSGEVATCRKMNSNAVVQMGPAGNNNDDSDSEFDISRELYLKCDYRDVDEITNILVWHGEVIYAIKFEYVKNGEGLVTIDAPSEYITGIRGHESRFLGGISSLSIVTNLKTYGPFGKVDERKPDREFDFQLGKDRRFGGFFGTLFDDNGTRLRSIGVYLKLSPPAT